MSHQPDINAPLDMDFPGGAKYRPRAGSGIDYDQEECILLRNVLGELYDDFAQNGAMTLTIGDEAIIGNTARIQITADGNAINLDADYTWRNVGSDAIGTTDGDVNILWICKISADVIEYVNKLNP